MSDAFNSAVLGGCFNGKIVAQPVDCLPMQRVNLRAFDIQQFMKITVGVEVDAMLCAEFDIFVVAFRHAVVKPPLNFMHGRV